MLGEATTLRSQVRKDSLTTTELEDKAKIH